MNSFVFLTGQDFQKVRQDIKKNSGKKIIFFSEDDELNRKVLEKEPINVLLLNQKSRRDKLNQRNSGLNHVLTKIAKQKNVRIGINLDEIIEAEQKTKSELLARVSQNIKLCNKNKLKMSFVSLKGLKKNIYDLKALGTTLKMPTWMTKDLDIFA